MLLRGVINLIQVNLTGVVVASVAAMGVGFAWYSPKMFGREWMKLKGVSGERRDKTAMLKVFIPIFLTTLMSAYILSLFMHYAGAFTIINGAKTGLWAYLGFVLPMGLANHLFSKKPFKLFLIESGHYLVGLLVMGGVLAFLY